MWLRARCPSSCAITTRTSRRVKRPSTSVSQSTTRRLGPSPVASAFGSDVSSLDVLDHDRDRAHVLDAARARTRRARSAGSLEPVRRDQVRARRTRRAARAPTKTGAASSHQQSPTRAREPHHDRERERRGTTNSPPSAEPVAEHALEVADVGEAVAARPTRARARRTAAARAQTSAKPEHPEQHPGAEPGPAADSRAKRAPRCA